MQEILGGDGVENYTKKVMNVVCKKYNRSK